MAVKSDPAMATATVGKDSKSWLPAIPQPVKRVFDQFPLVTYPPNSAPASSSTSVSGSSSTNAGANQRPGEHRLYIFTSTEAASKGRPSVNPQCLKWQTYLRFRGIPFRTIPSNNHASPDGALPFLLPAPGSGGTSEPGCVASSKLQKWVNENAECSSEDEEVSHFLNSAGRAYSSLLDHRIRDAWLYTVYLDGSNFESIARNVYVNSSTTNPIVRTALAYQLQDAARSQLQLKNSYIDADDILAEAEKAFHTLSYILADHKYFFTDSTPCLFDASFFSYTHLILDETLGWKYNPLAAVIKRYDNLVQHRQRLLDTYF
ncbi:hypothetical protein MGYG_03585 [Nannizzia gypsea CBS 118893]|uniref:Mitochondrial outer membrane protein n=1 Tax=Arthroderma gypseum (strain ATCC MYA-4604 / CBS 118893) TaxID=535722 RepID=E4USR5_ARTGP|nr:hypothetical protein MGYG_03585 [Nannizzia gypsea CBS 118893]EFR00580.1 hypothetical protein MGYG_03585 [Nannizzia gypsea CBS 118893]